MLDILCSMEEVMGTPLLCSMEEIDLTAEIIAAIKADAALGTAGLIANAQLAAEQTDPTALLDALGLESANLAHLVNAMIGTNIIQNNLDGTFDITVRNGDNTANLVTFRYDPVTGNKTVIS